MSPDVATGDHFLHMQHGVGKVQSVEERSLYGSPSARYVQIHFARDDLTVTMLEKDLPETLRELVSEKEARQLLDVMKSCDSRPSSNWKTRANANQAALDSGDPFEYARVAKGLAQFQSDGELRLSDRQHFNRSLELLTEELACTLSKSTNQARRLIEKAIAAS
jgi:CarD family transcriptional regulator